MTQTRPSGSANQYRGIYLNPPGMSVAYNSGNQALALAINPGLPQPAGRYRVQYRLVVRLLMGLGYPVAYGRQSIHSLQHAQQADVLDVVATPGGLWGGMDGIVTVSSNHPGGVNVCFTDGSVRFVKDSVGLQSWWAIGTRNGGEVISSDSY